MYRTSPFYAGIHAGPIAPQALPALQELDLVGFPERDMSVLPARISTRPLGSGVHPLPVRPCTRVKSTVVVSSMQALREAGYGDRYDARLSAAVREKLFSGGAPSWFPLDLAWTHYATCNALGLSNDEVMAIGARVAPVHASGVTIILRAARANGMISPWTVLESAPRYWQRMYEGAQLDVYRDGPKDARIVLQGQPLARLAYWRLGFQSVMHALTQALSSRVYTHLEVGRDESAGPPSLTVSLSWV
jgi:hypothetical protein